MLSNKVVTVIIGDCTIHILLEHTICKEILTSKKFDESGFDELKEWNTGFYKRLHVFRRISASMSASCNAFICRGT